MLSALGTDIYDALSERLDVPEAKVVLLNYFDLLTDTADHDIELGEKIKALFLQKPPAMMKCLNDTKLGYSTIIRLSLLLTPEFWTNSNVLQIKRRHALIIYRVVE